MNRRKLLALLVAATLVASPVVALSAAATGGPDDSSSATNPAAVDAGSATPVDPDPPGVGDDDDDDEEDDTPSAPQFETVVPEPELVPGIQQELTIQLINNDDDPQNAVRTARDLRVDVGSGDAPVEVLSGTRLAGAAQDGRPVTVTVRVSVPAGAEPGSYRIPIELTYEHLKDTSDDDDEEEIELVTNSTTVFATVRIDERPRFRVVETESSAPIGDSGTLNVTIENVGSVPAEDASVTLQTSSSSIAFGGSPSASQYAGEWAPGERRTLQYDVDVAPSAERRNYALQAVVAYEDSDGVPSESRPLRLGMTPLPEQTFDLRNVEGRLYVGEEGDVVAEVVNTGERRVDSVVVLFESASPTVSQTETQYAIGSLAPGESERVSFDAAVSDAAEDGPRQFTFRVQYRNDDGQQRLSDPLDVRVTVGERRPAFSVRAVGASVTAGQSATLELEITNNRDEVLSDISGKLFADSPISTTDDESFVPELGPGESTTVQFGISVGGGAMAKTYPVEIDFQYDDEEGESQISDTYQVPIDVSEPEDTGGPIQDNLPFVIAGVVVLLIVALGGFFYFRGE